MWTWERERRPIRQEPVAQLGQVTLTGAQAAVELGGERRWLKVCTPGGVAWRPRAGQQVLVLRGQEGEDPCILGSVEEHDLLPGQLRLAGGNCVLLLGDELDIQGSVKVNGETLEDYIRRVAGEGSA